MATFTRLQTILRLQSRRGVVVASASKASQTQFLAIATVLPNRSKVSSAYTKKDPSVSDKNRKAKAKQMEMIDDAFLRSGLSKSRRNLKKRPLVISTLGQIIDPYIPLSKKNFFLSPTGLKQRWQAFKSFLKSTYCVAVIKRKAKPFNISDFKLQAEKIYIATNEALASQDKTRLHTLTTEIAFHELRSAFKNRQIKWQCLGTASAPRIINIRVIPLEDKTNTFAQITVKLQLKQILAVYDQYNRLLTGSEDRYKQPTEYVVFERHLAKPNSPWRICGKIVPNFGNPDSTASGNDQSHMTMAAAS
ncbi:39S ribosomal protein L45, mitochondrial [Trichoplax sp. H2]|uniref:Large ribosomal subunit protein mL45 n=1 Tax=Trichoplax adhaerens TaxID=10228 RepID=B3RQ64_TRIAD|nr:hypothetical protein TRIADDRAFT_53791 [Trichoplax adhaerens]EDV28299.1 hypothetical protein TRIADDRAFT_53791 [Trichoplax adhaerens]RDD40760.1 39S ribosomal protein L45, mitochondrial [Trichoplax sp. H2]|eukprot:XP_002110133.1 hypothetical protein TRIADDRAFT_53791 [Trichoplax adhaerens]